jgi:L-ascorbate metabolism protein UlaG (beta-lactamase superfamily)
MAELARAARAGRRYLNPVRTTVGSPSMMFKVLYRYLATRAAREPRQSLGPFRTDAAMYATPPGSGLRVTWMGHSTSLLEMDGLRVLIDPVWERRAAPVQWFGPKRFFDPPLPLDSLPTLDLVLLSHDHFDHLGADTVRRLAASPAAGQAQWVCPLGVGKLLREFGAPAARVRELDWTESVEVAALKLTALPARHFSGRSLFNRFETLWASYVLATPGHRVYYGADSGEWEGFAAIGREYGPFDLTMLEIGAFDPLWADIHMGPDGALRTFQQLGGKGLLMPIHWGLFNLALHGWREPIERMFAEPGVRLWAPEPGQPTEVVAGEELRSEWWLG